MHGPTAVRPGRTFRTRGPFLERPGNLTGPESDFDMKVSRKVGRVLASIEVHFVSPADNFKAQFSNLLKLSLEWKTKQLNGPGNYRELRETGRRSSSLILRAQDFSFLICSKISSLHVLDLICR